MVEITLCKTATETFQDMEVQTTEVRVGKQSVGRLVELSKHMVNWKPVAALGLQIPEMTCFSREGLLKTVEPMIQRQLDRLAKGEALTDQDIDPLHPDLRECVIETSFGEALKHPLLFAVPYHDLMAPIYNARLEYGRAAAKQALDERKWGSYIALHERAYRLDAILDIVDDIPDADYWNLVGDFWTDSENIYQNFDEWLQLWEAETPGRESAMDERERAALAAMPDVLTVHRGYQHEDSMMGLSWTLDHKRAIWFANRTRRPDEPGYVVTAKVRKEDVLAYFMGREEEEIVALPESLFDATTQELPQRKKA